MPTPSAASREQPRMTVTPLPVARLRLGAGALAGAAVIGVTSVNAPLLLIAGVLGIGFIAVTLVSRIPESGREGPPRVLEPAGT